MSAWRSSPPPPAPGSWRVMVGLALARGAASDSAVWCASRWPFRGGVDVAAKAVLRACFAGGAQVQDPDPGQKRGHSGESLLSCDLSAGTRCGRAPPNLVGACHVWFGGVMQGVAAVDPPGWRPRGCGDVMQGVPEPRQRHRYVDRVPWARRGRNGHRQGRIGGSQR